MRLHRPRTIATLAAAAAALLAVPAAASAAASTPPETTFAGTITYPMTVNNGTNTGAIAAGTPYTGTLTYAAGQTPQPVAYGGGTHTVYTFDRLTFTIGPSTATSGPGRIDVYDNLTTSTSYPKGDSVYVNFGGVAPSGLLAGAAFNWMGIGLIDASGTTVSNGALPSLELASFPTHFTEFNFGTRGTPWGAGNTSTIQSLTSLTSGGTGTPPPPPPPPPPAPISFAPVLPGGTAGVAYASTFASATGGSGSFTYSAAGLPPGLALSGRTVSGTPTAPGTYTVTLTATDSSSKAATSTVSMTIAPAPAPAPPPPPPPPSGGSGGSGGSSSGPYTVKDRGKGRITDVGPNDDYVMVGTKKLIWNGSTMLNVKTPLGVIHSIDPFVEDGMRVQWKGRLDPATNTVLTSKLVIN